MGAVHVDVEGERVCGEDECLCQVAVVVPVDVHGAEAVVAA